VSRHPVVLHREDQLSSRSHRVWRYIVSNAVMGVKEKCKSCGGQGEPVGGSSSSSSSATSSRGKSLEQRVSPGGVESQSLVVGVVVGCGRQEQRVRPAQPVSGSSSRLRRRRVNEGVANTSSSTSTWRIECKSVVTHEMMSQCLHVSSSEGTRTSSTSPP